MGASAGPTQHALATPAVSAAPVPIVAALIAVASSERLTSSSVDPHTVRNVRSIVSSNISREFHKGSYPLVRNPVDDDSSLALRRDVAAPFQAGKMVADSTLGHPEMCDYLTNGTRPLKQKPDDLQARRIAKSPNELS